MAFLVDLQLEEKPAPITLLAAARCGAIACRTLAPGSRLPDERELARQFALSRRTIRRALAELENASLLTPARGTFVADDRAAPAIPLTAVMNDMGFAAGPGFGAHVVRAMVRPRLSKALSWGCAIQKSPPPFDRTRC